jgi:hypothetical protein
VKQTHKGHRYARNRPAAHWRAVLIHAMRIGGHSYASIGDWFDISAERARQICARPIPSAQLKLNLVRQCASARFAAVT